MTVEDNSKGEDNSNWNDTKERDVRFLSNFQTTGPTAIPNCVVGGIHVLQSMRKTLQEINK